MTRNAYAPDFKDLPEVLPIFPLEGVLLLPTGQMPLNIFEPRYVQMVRDCLGRSRLIGMIQTNKDGSIFNIGCAGKIIDFTETEDGRFLITLHGITRFQVMREMPASTPYRQVQPDWKPFVHDLEKITDLSLDRALLKSMLRQYFTQNELSCDWQKIDEASDDRLITCLSMVCPFSNAEKQALLEAPCGATRANMFMMMLDIAVRSGGPFGTGSHH
jgi:hypothetical protein